MDLEHTPPEGTSPPRRAFLKKSLAVLAVGAAAGVPMAAGVAVWGDPLLRGDKPAGEAPFLPVTTLDRLPADGKPHRFVVLADVTNAWQRALNVPVGNVYLRRDKAPDGTDRVRAWNWVCPHAGCYVEPLADGSFKCPCHNSHFKPDGSADRERGCVSPRGLDELDVAVEDGRVKVRFQNFLAGTAKKVPQV